MAGRQKLAPKIMDVKRVSVPIGLFPPFSQIRHLCARKPWMIAPKINLLEPERGYQGGFTTSFEKRFLSRQEREERLTATLNALLKGIELPERFEDEAIGSGRGRKAIGSDKKIRKMPLEFEWGLKAGVERKSAPLSMIFKQWHTALKGKPELAAAFEKFTHFNVQRLLRVGPKVIVLRVEPLKAGEAFHEGRLPRRKWLPLG